MRQCNNLQVAKFYTDSIIERGSKYLKWKKFNGEDNNVNRTKSKITVGIKITASQL
jgi:hypothetical protein